MFTKQQVQSYYEYKEDLFQAEVKRIDTRIKLRETLNSSGYERQAIINDQRLLDEKIRQHDFVMQSEGCWQEINDGEIRYKMFIDHSKDADPELRAECFRAITGVLMMDHITLTKV